MTIEPKTKTKKRARSQEDKEREFQRILTVGQKLFVSLGTYGFSMGDLAKKLGMTRGNLYHYIESKRDLYFAILNKCWKRFTDSMDEIMINHVGSFQKVMNKITSFYIEFFQEPDEPITMIFLIDAPIPKNKENFEEGPWEMKFSGKDQKDKNKEQQKKDKRPIVQMIDIVEKAIQAKELVNIDPVFFALFLWSIVHGAAGIMKINKHTLQNHRKKCIKEKKPLIRFEDFIIQQIQFLIKMYCTADTNKILEQQTKWKSIKKSIDQYEETYL
jgi:AcrR family transcriptional regulator